MCRRLVLADWLGWSRERVEGMGWWRCIVFVKGEAHGVVVLVIKPNNPQGPTYGWYEVGVLHCGNPRSRTGSELTAWSSHGTGKLLSHAYCQRAL